MRYFLTILFTILTGILVLSQTSTTFAGNSLTSSPISFPHPVTFPTITIKPNPTTTPTPSKIPVTYPKLTVTPTPIPNYNYKSVSGYVAYKVGRWELPAARISIVAINANTSERYTTNTNFLGRYSFNLKQGNYKITVTEKNKNITFFPPSYLITLNKNINNLTFIGYHRSFSGLVNPVINNINPKSGYLGSRFVLKGKEFDPIASNNQIYVEEILMPTAFNIISRDGKELSFILNSGNNFEAGKTYPVYLVNKNGVSNKVTLNITSSVKLLQVKPEKVSIGQTLTLIGKGFGKIKGTVLFYQDQKLIKNITSIKSWNDQEIKLTVPVLNKGQKYQVIVSTAKNNSVSYNSNKVNLFVK